MKRAIALISLLLFAGPGGSQAMEPLDWRELGFDEVAGSPASIAVEMAASGLLRKEDSPYRKNLAAGEHRLCILEMLAILGEIEAAMTDEALAGDPSGRRFEYLRLHGGRSWLFWSQLAELCRAAEAFGQTELLIADAWRLRDEMELALIPLLAPELPAPAPERGR
jgi:hypothetical protein